MTTTQSQTKTLLAQIKTVSLALGRLSFAAEVKKGSYDTLGEINNLAWQMRHEMTFDKTPVIAELLLVLESAKAWSIHESNGQHKQAVASQLETQERVGKVGSALHGVMGAAISALLAE